MWGPTKKLGPIGSAVLTFIGNKQTANRQEKYLYVYFTCLGVGSKIGVGLHVTPGKVYGWSNFQKICLHQNSIFENVENPRNFLLNPRNLLFDLFQDV